MSNKQHLAIEMDRGNQPVLVSANVKHVEVADLVCCIEGALQFCLVGKGCGLDDLAPRLQRGISIAMDHCELGQGFVGDHPHRVKYISF
jgi:hypothetical protein